MKGKIVVQWKRSDADYNRIYGNKEMRVIKSNHPRFTVGHRFDWSFADIAGQEGYEITIKSMDQ